MSGVRLSILFRSVAFWYACIIPSPCGAADVTLSDGRVDGTSFVSIAGEIKKGDLSKVKVASKEASGVKEIRIRETSGAYRIIYVASFADAVFVLHAFQKKAQKTAAQDLALATTRFKDLSRSFKK